MAITYMQRRKSGIYEFRRMMPKALAGKAVPLSAQSALAEITNPLTGRFKRELTISLKTSDTREAKRLDSIEAARVSALFAKAEAMVSAGGMLERHEHEGVALTTAECAVMAEYGVGASTTAPEGAGVLLGFICSAAARQILESHGFQAPALY